MSEKTDPLKMMPSEGDLNTSPLRRTWIEEHIDADTQSWLQADARCFLHQSLSTLEIRRQKNKTVLF